MRVFYLVLFLFFCVTNSFGQKTIDTLKEKVFYDVDKLAEFPEGILALHKYLIKNLSTLKIIDGNQVATTITLEFIVDKTGDICNIKVLRGKDLVLIESIIDVLNKMPLWHPAIKNDVTVNAYYKLPISIHLK